MDRSLHLVDLENLTGEGRDDPDSMAAASLAYRAAALMGPYDQTIVGTGGSTARRISAGLLWRGAQTVSRTGRDGADLAILDAVDLRWIVARGFRRVVIGSGDHCFAEPATRLRAMGIHILVVARERCVHWELYRAASEVRLLPRPNHLSA